MVDLRRKITRLRGLKGSVEGDSTPGGIDRRRRDAVLMAAISFLLVMHRRSSGEPWQVIGGEAVLAMILIGLAFSMQTNLIRPSGVTFRRQHQFIFLFSVLAVLVPTLSRVLLLALAMNAAAWEMVMLTTLGLAAIALVLCSQRPKHASLSVVCSGFLTLFTTAISDSGTAIYFAILWVLLCLYWMVANHWQRLDVHLAQTIRRQNTLRMGTTLLGVLICSVAVFVAWGRGPATRLIERGIMPTSGGNRWHDVTATSGVGDGDAVVAAKENAASFGAVESDLFLQSDLPSLFDMFDDTIGEVTLKRRSEKAMALPNQTPVGEEQQYAQSLKGSASFSTSREPAKTNKKLSDRDSTAALHWIGPAGISLALNRFAHFDGIDWHDTSPNEPPLQSPIPLSRQAINEAAWFFRSDRLRPSEFFGEARGDAIKFIKLKSPRIPTPAGVAGVHIQDVDREDFFAVTEDDGWLMPGRETIPAMTVIRLVTRQVDGDRLRTATFPNSTDSVLASNDGNLPTSPSRLTAGMTRAHQIANAVAGEHPRGWTQVQSLVQHLRDEFTVDRQVALKADDPLDDFLQRKVGGDHMFATAAAEMLRSLDYQTRLVTGFYADPNDVDHLAGHTEVGPDDAHVWLEVLADQGVWIPLEPTPGYRQPQFQRGLASLAIELAWMAAPWVGGAGLMMVAVWWSRRWWVDWLCHLAWHLSYPTSRAWRVWLLIRLLDIRCRLAGHSRPVGITPRRWYLELSRKIDAKWLPTIQGFFDSADQAFYSTHRSHSDSDGDRRWRVLANEMNRRLTVRQIRKSLADADLSKGGHVFAVARRSQSSAATSGATSTPTSTPTLAVHREIFSPAIR